VHLGTAQTTFSFFFLKYTILKKKIRSIEVQEHLNIDLTDVKAQYFILYSQYRPLLSY